MPNAVVNLKQARKKKKRAAKASAAKSNREKFGRTKVEKALEKLEAEQREKHLDQHKVDAADA